eukprot:Ihof_evm6s214 gene=Ihof_evmTU6s214
MKKSTVDPNVTRLNSIITDRLQRRSTLTLPAPPASTNESAPIAPAVSPTLARAASHESLSLKKANRYNIDTKESSLTRSQSASFGKSSDGGSSGFGLFNFLKPLQSSERKMSMSAISNVLEESPIPSSDDEDDEDPPTPKRNSDGKKGPTSPLSPSFKRAQSRRSRNFFTFSRFSSGSMSEFRSSMETTSLSADELPQVRRPSSSRSPTLSAGSSSSFFGLKRHSSSSYILGRLSGSQPSSPSNFASPDISIGKSTPSAPFIISPHGGNLWQNQPEVVDIVGTLTNEEIERQEAMYQIIESEQIYVRDLETAKKVYLLPITKFKVLEVEEAAEIFGDFEHLLDISTVFLKELKQRREEEGPVIEDISDILLSFFADIYVNYHRQCEKIRSVNCKTAEYIQSKTVFSSFLDLVARQQENMDTMPLQTYLLKPVQRITTYTTLLRNLKRATPITHSSYSRVEEVMAIMDSAVKGINDFKRSCGQTQILADIQTRLDMSAWATPVTLAEPGRVLVKEGMMRVWLFKTGDREKKDYYCYLFNDMMILTKRKKRPTSDQKTLHRSQANVHVVYNGTVCLTSCFPFSSEDQAREIAVVVTIIPHHAHLVPERHPLPPPQRPSIMYKVVGDPFYLATAETHVQGNKMVFEVFSSYTMTMYVIEVPLTLDKAEVSGSGTIHNEMWIDIMESTVMANKKKLDVDTASRQNLVEEVPKLNFVQANLWKNQPGARESMKLLDKNEIQRQECIHELITSERGYVNDLNATITLFYRPLHKFRILEPKDIEFIFGDIPKLFRINTQFCEDLEERKREQWPCYEDISDILVPFFEQIYDYYANHCQKTKECSSEVVALQKSCPVFADFMKALVTADGVDVLGLNSYIIKPLQRITKYNLLLRELVRYTPKTHSSYPGVCKAYELVGKALTDINEYQRQSEFAQQLKEVQSHLEMLPNETVELASPGRYLRQQGSAVVDILLKNKVKVTVKDAYCFVFNDSILFTKKKPHKRSAIGKHHSKPLSRQSGSMKAKSLPGLNPEYEGMSYKVIGRLLKHHDATATVVDNKIHYKYTDI